MGQEEIKNAYIFGSETSKKRDHFRGLGVKVILKCIIEK
jgi:hypothetical protein